MSQKFWKPVPSDQSKCRGEGLKGTGEGGGSADMKWANTSAGFLGPRGWNDAGE